MKIDIVCGTRDPAEAGTLIGGVARLHVQIYQPGLQVQGHRAVLLTKKAGIRVSYRLPRYITSGSALFFLFPATFIWIGKIKFVNEVPE